MAIQILLPALPPTTPPARLVRWRVAVGQQVAVGDVIAEIASGPTTIEVESTFTGRIERILIPENTWSIPPNTAIALLTPDDEVTSAVGASDADIWQPFAKAPSPRTNHNPESGVLASPRARKLAHAYSIDLHSLPGSGPDGRIVSRDVEAVLAERARTSTTRGSGSLAHPRETLAEHPLDTQVPQFRRPETEQQPASAATAPSVYAGQTSVTQPARPNAAVTLENATSVETREVPCARLTIDCSIDALLRWRLERDAPAGGTFVSPFATSPAVVFTKALGHALADIPAANVSWTPSGLHHHGSADVAFAVLVPELQVMPVIRNVDRRSLDEIAQCVIDLNRRAQNGELEAYELGGCAVSILDLGAYGISTFEPVLEPPRAISLSLGARQSRPVFADGEIRSTSIITCSLSCDVRAVPVAVAAELLATIRALVDEPRTLLSPRAGHAAI